MKSTLTMVYQQNGDGWITSSISEYPGVISQGWTTRRSMRDGS